MRAVREDVPDTLPALFEKAEILLRCPVTPWHDIIYKETRVNAGLVPEPGWHLHDINSSTTGATRGF